MLSGIGSALAGIGAHRKLLDATAQNLANVNTDGYKSLAVTLSEGAGSGVRAQVGRVDTEGPRVSRATSQGETLVDMSNVDLAQELVNLILGKGGVGVNIKSIQVQDEMLGSLMDIFG